MAAVSKQFSFRATFDECKNRVAGYFSTYVVYLTAESLHQVPATVLRNKIIILSRACYRESIVSYPIASVSELKKILKLQDKHDCNYHFIGDLKEGARNVVTLTVFPQFIEHCQQALAVVPVSLLVNYAVAAPFVTVETADCKFFSQKAADGLWHSVLQSKLIDTSERARLALGVSLDIPVTEYKLHDQKQLANSLLKIPTRFWSSCLRKHNANYSEVNLKPLLLVTTFLGVLYLVLTSLYLNLTISNRQRAFDSLFSETQAVSAARRQLERDQALLTFLAQQQGEPLQSVAFWSVYASWQLQDIRIVSVRSDFNEIQLQGEASSATAVLQQTLNLPYVEDASFVSPVRRGAQGREVFTLVLTLNRNFKQEAPVTDEPVTKRLNAEAAGEAP